MTRLLPNVSARAERAWRRRHQVGRFGLVATKEEMFALMGVVCDHLRAAGDRNEGHVLSDFFRRLQGSWGGRVPPKQPARTWDADFVARGLRAMLEGRSVEDTSDGAKCVEAMLAYTQWRKASAFEGTGAISADIFQAMKRAAPEPSVFLNMHQHLCRLHAHWNGGAAL